MSEKSDVKKGFNVTMGIILALLLIFIILPLGMCGGCALLGIGSAVVAPSALKGIKESKVSEASLFIPEIASAIEVSYAKNCKLPPFLPASSSIPAGGSKQVPVNSTEWDSLGLKLNDPLYFSYKTIADGKGVSVVAEANFNPASVQSHTMKMTLTPGAEKCSLSRAPIVTTDKFE